jgi:3-oxoisoapionate decarboxylase
MSRASQPAGRLPAGVCIFGLTYNCGLTWAGTERANPAPLSAAALVTLAAEHGLCSVELPASLAGDDLGRLRQFGEEQDVRFIVAGGLVDREALAADIQVAAALGAPVLRCILSRVLCGDRRTCPGGWREHLDRCTRELEHLVPLAEQAGVALAIENHQDADSADLLRLCRRFESAYLGVTLDTGNPLAVMEDPVDFAERLAPYLRHTHLKDYRVYPAPTGFRLTRCSLGAGVIDFPALFGLFDRQEWPITRSIEAAALQARLIPILDPGWWESFPARDVRSVLPALSLVWKHLRPADETWQTPFERDAPPQELCDLEWREFRESVAYLRGLVTAPAAHSGS